MSHHRPLFVGALVVLSSIAACNSSTKREEAGLASQALISDQLHNGGSAGFVFLPPMVPPPANNGGFLTNVPAMVRIDETTAAGVTVRTLATFTKTSGPEHEHLRMHVEGGPPDADDHDGDTDSEGFYLARWQTNDAHLSESAHYRVRVLVPAKGGGTHELGFADVDVVRNAREFRSVDTQNFAPLINGSTLRIKFRIDAPAVDQDRDGVFDWVDNCPTVANADQKDSLHNGIGDACRCLGVTCTPSDACHAVGACQGATGTCSNPVLADGTACPIVNAGAACAAGVCQLTACNAGFADCNGTLADGCETPTTTIANCGMCGAACGAAPNSSPSCSAGRCALSCGTGFADCDGNVTNGCEQNVASDASNCGACGHACGFHETCVAGSCTTGVCQTGYADCNGNQADGCEALLSTDPANCGHCGRACALANAGTTCSAGACALTSCNPGFADCDGNAANGCEVNDLTDVANCGRCGAACSLPHAAPACNVGVCAVAACSVGFADCNGSAADGCEVGLAADTNNCGACGNACHVPNAAPVCASGACGIAACNPGFADCNGNPNDGCEVSLSDVASCGVCGRVCTAGPNSSAACVANACTLQCATGFADCDHNTSNGCEVALTGDTNNCGACGVVCNAHETCQSGACSTAVCQAGYGDCNHTPTDGCEASLASDANNCAACGNVCSFPNAVPDCINSSCGWSVCQTNFGDCDGVAANGCEASLSNDPRNCGGCGVACSAGPTCRAGACFGVSFVAAVAKECNGTAVPMTATATGGVAPLTFSFNFDDGTTFGVQPPTSGTTTIASTTHAWTPSKTVNGATVPYAPVVTVTDANGATLQQTIYVIVSPPFSTGTQCPVPNDSWMNPGQCCELPFCGSGYETPVITSAGPYSMLTTDPSVHFVAQIADAELTCGDELTYAWQISAGGSPRTITTGILSSSGPLDVVIPTFALHAAGVSSPGRYPVTLNLTSRGGATATSSTSLSIFATPTACSASSSPTQVFDGTMTGCPAPGMSASVAYANRASLCNSSCHVCSAAEWVAHSGPSVPTSSYWISDSLNLVGGASNNCSVSTTSGSNPCAGGSMLVCPPAAGHCILNGCGLDTTTSQFFGGCSAAGPSTAEGTLCCCP